MEPQQPGIAPIRALELRALNDTITKIRQRLDALDRRSIDSPAASGDVLGLRQLYNALLAQLIALQRQVDAILMPEIPDPISYGRSKIIDGETVTMPDGHILFTTGSLRIEGDGSLRLEGDAYLYEIAPGASTPGESVSHARSRILAGEQVVIPAGHVMVTPGTLRIDGDGSVRLDGDAMIFELATATASSAAARNLFIQVDPPTAVEPILWIKPTYDGFGAITDAALILRMP